MSSKSLDNLGVKGLPELKLNSTNKEWINLKRITIVLMTLIFISGAGFNMIQAGEKFNLSDFFLYKVFDLDARFSGVEGKIILLLDKGLSNYKNPSEIYDPEVGYRDSMTEIDFKNAVLCTLDKNGKIIDRISLEKPYADISVDYLYGGEKPTYIIKEDYSTGSGSYNGPIRTLLEVSKGKMSFLKVRDGFVMNKKIAMMSSLKNSWKFTQSKNGNGKDIVKAQYHPDWDAPAAKNDTDELPFVTEITRYYFDGKKWNGIVKIIKGGSEFEDESNFPDASLFP